MIGVGWRKIGRDLRCYPQQTWHTILAIGISVFTLTTLLVSRAVLVESLTLATVGVAQPDAIFAAAGLPVAVLERIQALPHIAHAGAGRSDSFRMSYGDELWYELRLQARSDLTATQHSQLNLASGEWPQGAPVTLALERSTQDVTAARPGDTVRLYRDNLGEAPVQVAGVIYDPAATPSRFLSNLLHGFATLDGLTQLTGRSGYDRIYLFLTPELGPAARAETLAAVEAMLAESGLAYSARQPEPASGTLIRFVETSITLLSALALLGTLLSVVWVSNVMMAIMAREQASSGVLKTLGFERRQIVALYLGQALLLGAVASLVALVLSYPAGLLCAYAVAAWLLAKEVTELTPPLPAFAVGLGLGLGAPVLGALHPVWRGTALTVREALGQAPGVIDRFGQSWLERVGRASRVSPQMLYAGRNLLRHKRRLVFTMVTLVLAGMIFVTATTLGTSLQRTLETVMNYWLADVRFETQVPVGGYLVRNEVLALPGIANVEARLVDRSVRLRPDGSHSPREINLVGLPPDSPFLQPTLVAGRWLRTDDQDGIVVDTELLRMEPDLRVGSRVVLDVAGAPVAWQIVGVATSQFLGYSLTHSAAAYVTYRYLSESSGRGGQANFFLVGTTEHSAAAQLAAARRIEDSLHRYRFSPTVMEPNFVRLATTQQIFGLVKAVVLAMSLLFALVGGLSLANLMSLNVLERRREIGMIRALGGDSRTLNRLITGEAVAIGFGSGVVALLAAWPVSWLLCQQTGMALLNTPLTYQYAGAGACGWLLLSVLFAWASTRRIIRDMASRAVREILS